jgi:hypothetical protein
MRIVRSPAQLRTTTCARTRQSAGAWRLAARWRTLASSAASCGARARGNLGIGASSEAPVPAQSRPWLRNGALGVVPELPDVTVYIEALERRVVGQPLARVRIWNPATRSRSGL